MACENVAASTLQPGVNAAGRNTPPPGLQRGGEVEAKGLPGEEGGRGELRGLRAGLQRGEAGSARVAARARTASVSSDAPAWGRATILLGRNAHSGAHHGEPPCAVCLLALSLMLSLSVAEAPIPPLWQPAAGFDALAAKTGADDYGMRRYVLVILEDRGRPR